MGTTVDISSLLTEFKRVRITNVTETRSLGNHIAELEEAWKLGNTDDAKRHATNVQRIVKRYKDRFTVQCLKTIELISSGECVPPTPASSTRPVSAISTRSKSGMTPTMRLANEKTPKTDGMGSGRKKTVHEQQQRGERVTAATSKGSNANQSKGNKPNNEKETEEEREMRVQGIKAKAHQRQSDKNTEEQLRIIRDRMEELAATIIPQAKDVNTTPPHIEDNMSLTEAIISQYQEVLELYKHEKDRIKDAEKRLKDMFRNVTKQEYEPDAKGDNRKEKPNKPTDLKELVGDIENRFKDYTRREIDEKGITEAMRMYEMCTGEKYQPPKQPTVDSIAQLLKQKLERISDVEQRLKDMFRNVTKQEYAPDSKKDNRKGKQSKSVDLKQLVGDIESRFEDYTRKTTDEKIAKEAIRMYEMCTGEKYKLSKQPTVDSIANLLKQKLDSKMAEEKVENEAIRMYEICTGEKYRPTKEPTVDSIAQLLKQKLESLSQHGRQEKEQHGQLQKEKDDLQKRISDVEQRLKDMFRNVTKQEYGFDSKQDNRNEKQSKSMDLDQLVRDIENRFEDYTRKMADEKVANEAIRMYEICTGKKYRPSKEPTVDSIAHLLKQELERISDAEQRLKDMFRNVTKQEYASGAKKDNRDEKQSKSVDLKQLVGDIENRFEDYSRKMTDERIDNEAIRMYEMCTGEKYKLSKQPTVDSIAQLLKQRLDSLSKHGRQENEQHGHLQKEIEDLQKRISDAEQRLKEMFRNVTKQEYASDARKDNRNEKQSKSVDLEQLVRDIENRFEDYTRKMADEKVANEAIRLYEICTGEKYETSNEPAVDSIAELLKQKLDSDGMVSGRKATVDEQQDSDDMVAGRKPTCEGRQDTDDMVAERKPICTGRQETTQKDTTHDNQPQQLKYKRDAWIDEEEAGRKPTRDEKQQTDHEVIQRLQAVSSIMCNMAATMKIQHEQKAQPGARSSNNQSGIHPKSEDLESLALIIVQHSAELVQVYTAEKVWLSQQLSHERKRNEEVEKEKNELLASLSHQLSVEKNKYKTLKTEKDEMYQRLSGQLSHIREMYLKIETERDELLNRLQQPSEENKTHEALENEKEEVHKRLKQQLDHAKRQYEQLMKEKDELLNRLSKQYSQEKKTWENLQNEKDELLNRLSEQLDHEKSQYEKLEKEKNELLDSLSQQLNQEKERCEKLQNEKDELLNRFSEKLSEERNKSEKLKNETEEMHRRLSEQLRYEKRQYENLEKEKDELRDRLTQHVSAKLTKDNPDIYRPTKIGEMYSELHDKEWTDAYELLTETIDEKEAIKILLDVLTISYSYCLRHSKTQHMLIESVLILPVTTVSVIEQPSEKDLFERMTQSVLTGRQALGDIEQKLMVDLGKATKGMSVDNVVEEGVNAVLSRWAITDPSDHFRSYVQQCLRICWFMCQQSPRMFIEVNIAKYSGATFDKSTFKEYVKTGKNIEYVVWLPLFLHDGGNLIRKGVANGK